MRDASAAVTALTGITDEMVAGQRFDDAAITAFVESGVITIAHNSGFDRKFAERYWPLFEHKAWGCSMSEIDWRKHGFAGAQLGVTDQNLAGNMTGTDLAEYARGRHPWLNIIVMSGTVVDRLPPRMVFLQKPFVPRQLLDAVRD